MPVGRARTNARPARRFSKGEAGGTFLGNEIERSFHQGFPQVAVVIAALFTVALVFAPTHVNGVYMITGPNAAVLFCVVHSRGA